MSALPTKLETLAIHGGSPVRERLLPYGRQSLDDADIQAVVEVLKSDWLTTGPKIAEFEERFAEWVGARHAVSYSSGTAALHGAISAPSIAALHASIPPSPMPMTASPGAPLLSR